MVAGLIPETPLEKELVMKLNRIAAAATAAAAVAIVSGAAVTQHGATVTLSADSHSVISQSAKPHAHPARSHPAGRKSSPADPSLAWLESRGGQAQVTFNNAVDVLAGDLEIESHSPTVANHLVFEADARTVRARAEKILSTPALLPRHNRAAYERMLRDFITVANLLQPGPGYGTTPQDYAAWYTATQASDITVW
jgi:hypothetical protein